MNIKANTSKGTRDFNSSSVYKREYIINTIKSCFRNYGFSPIETPSFENSNTLLGKYGDEGDRLIFKILKSGNFLKGVDNEILLNPNDNLNIISKNISDKALRYDLTIPFARYVVQNQNEIHLPFKRYQIQLVWRADRPQNGRFREFLQCDADVIGSKSLLQEVDFIHLFNDVFNKLRVPNFKIRINHRKILVGLSEILDLKEKFIDLTVILDKIDKIGIDKVVDEVLKIGLKSSLKSKLIDFLNISGSFNDKLDYLKKLFINSKIGLEGIEDLRYVYDNIVIKKLHNNSLELDISLARGLSYYTGVIYEVSTNSGVKVGSIAAGGRYDNLTSLFGLNNVSGIGISFGLDRIYLVMDSLNLFPEIEKLNTKVLFINLNKNFEKYVINAVTELRENNINTDFYPDIVNLKKQLKYANNIKVKYSVIVGENEFKNSKYLLKDMYDGSQSEHTLKGLIEKLK
ncbi:MAG: histidine--tRNA ligase [Flavobacteriaceae bacterium]|nr:histidine--tRNA ligase [Flavobacteriaceae bacterium]